jgi:hypothetical protein
MQEEVVVGVVHTMVQALLDREVQVEVGKVEEAQADLILMQGQQEPTT